MLLGANGTVTVTGYLAEAAGGSTIRFALSDTPAGSSAGRARSAPQLSALPAGVHCVCCYLHRAGPVASTGVTYVVATAGDSPAKTEAAVLLNTAAVTSNPAIHQGQLAAPMLLGSSGGNNNDLT